MTVSPLDYLDSQKVEYSLIPHFTSYTAQETAYKSHINGKKLSKVVIVSSDDKQLMVVIPANCIIVQHVLARVLNSSKVSIVPEYQFKDRFQGCEIGAMPAFGNLYGIDVLIAKELLTQDSIVFDGGTHNTLIKMKISDFIRLTSPQTIARGYKKASLVVPIITKLKDDWQWR